MRVDAHHHLWRYTEQEYGWIDDSMQPLRRDYLPAEFYDLMNAAGVHGGIAVQARQTLEETRWLLELAAKWPAIRGVVGWAPIGANSFRDTLDELRLNPVLRGLRHVVQAEPDGFLDNVNFNRGIDALRGTGLVYDLLIFARQLAEATRFVDRHPAQTFVLDHIAKPDIAGSGFQVWNASIRELAGRDNVVCKLSGVVTEADWRCWTPELLFPYFETVLEVFGPSRLMVGSDWPVLTLACDYTQWWRVVEGWLAPLSSGERDLIEGGVASRIYRLSEPGSNKGSRS